MQLIISELLMSLLQIYTIIWTFGNYGTLKKPSEKLKGLTEYWSVEVSA